MKNYVITAKMLVERGACPSAVRKFLKLFGASATVTVAGCHRVAGEFDWGWAAAHLLSAPAYKAWREAAAPAEEAYQKAMDSAYKAYQKAKAVAFARCVRKYGLREE